MINIIAPAKLNLCLHITGRRSDGYHLLDSLFVFTTLGDEITISPAETLSMTIDGPFHTVIDTPIENNLVYRAALLLKQKFNVSTGAHIHLSKQLPVGSGLGGGSSDAAVTLKALNAFWKLNADASLLAEIGLSLGADIPACLYQKSARISGIGEIIEPLSTEFNASPVLLIKPPESLSTPAVYKQYATSNRPFSKKIQHLETVNFDTFIKQMHEAHNDLEEPAIALMPSIQDLLALLTEQPGCLLTRMSGSGSTCFALFSNKYDVKNAKKMLQTRLPHHWIKQTEIIWSLH
ncbi:MAG: 4-(cytidine 5'-diphospho)-2-C-methyl-D-erythritol kinase [Coxiellaceae bacterium]|nr:4-(cytidine 5'-diphospho)-2-C-methyl-D-erythritol kinase [Coxiellaceae bacterium]